MLSKFKDKGPRPERRREGGGRNGYTENEGGKGRKKLTEEMGRGGDFKEEKARTEEEGGEGSTESG